MRYKDKKEARIVNEPSLKRPKGVSDEQWNRALDLYEVARKKGDKFPELTVAQAALETGWFKHMSGNYNYFGQKASKSQKGSAKVTKEFEGNKSFTIVDRFRDYDSLEVALDDRLKKWGSKYKNAENIDEAIGSIWQYDPETGKGKGYATDINYDRKIKRILTMMGVNSQEKASPDRTVQRKSVLSNPARDKALFENQVKIDNTAVNVAPVQKLLEPLVINDVQTPTESTPAVEQARDNIEEEQSKFHFAQQLLQAAQVKFIEPIDTEQPQTNFQEGGTARGLSQSELFASRQAFIDQQKGTPFQEIDTFNMEEDTNFAERAAAKLLVGEEALQGIESIYNQLVTFKNKRGNSNVMSKEELDLRKRISNANTHGYPEDIEEISQIADRINKGEGAPDSSIGNWSEENVKLRKNLNDKYYGLKYDKSAVREAEFRPTISTGEEVEYVDFDKKLVKQDMHTMNRYFGGFDNMFEESQGGTAVNLQSAASRFGTGVNKSGRGMQGGLGQLANFTMSSGEDERGRYVSYYDKWDLDPPIVKEKGIDIDKLNNPFDIYGRIYEDEFMEEVGEAAAIKDAPSKKDRQAPHDSTSLRDGGKVKKDIDKEKFLKELSRVYRRKDSRVKNELNFRTVAGKRVSKTRTA